MKKSDITELRYGLRKMQAARGPGVFITYTSRGTSYRVNPSFENSNQSPSTSTTPRWQ